MTGTNCLCVSTNRLSLRLSVRIEQLSHSLAWVFEVSGLRPEAVFCMSGRSPAGVDYYDAATVRCKSGATIALSGAATIPGHVATSDEKGHGFHLDVRIFGSEGKNELSSCLDFNWKLSICRERPQTTIRYKN